MILPNFMRARGMAVHQMVFFGSMVVGSLLWGKVATHWSPQTALLISALTLAPATVLAGFIRLPGSSQPKV
jgi:Kef-type K+ transport system membrane component KefB